MDPATTTRPGGASGTMAKVSIASQYAHCKNAFNQLLENVEKLNDQAVSRQLLNEFGRFRVWAGNAGAHRSGRVSLDHRLREASHIYDELTKLLGELKKNLEQGVQALKPIEVGEGDHSPHSELLVSLGDDFMEEQGSLEDDEAELSDFEHSVLDIMHIITCLYKLSITIQNPAPKERLHKIASINVSYFEDWDIKHINEKFCPATEGDFRVAEYLSERLGKANTRRRQLLRYYEAHHKKIAKHIDDPSPSKIVRTPTNTPKPVAPTVTDGGSTRASERVPGGLERRASLYTTTTDSQTTVPTIKVELNQAVGNILLNEDQLSQTSYATSTNHRMRIRVPPPPNEIAAFDDMPFECPYCFTITKIKGRQDWKKHVFSDLQPYVCTFPDCPKEDELYGSQREWFDHEVQLHRREWYCDACLEPFPQKSLFQEHIRAKHSELVTEGNFEAVIGRCERAIVSGIGCPLCGIDLTFQTLEKHLGLHLQEIALFALPRPLPDEGSIDNKSMNVGFSSECSSEYSSRKSSLNLDSDGKESMGGRLIIPQAAIEGVRCICSYQHDDGFLITCGNCKELQHGVCMGIDKNNVPEAYECSACIPGAHHLEVEKAIIIQEDYLKSISQEASKTDAHIETPHGGASKLKPFPAAKLRDDGILEPLKMSTPLDPLKRHQEVRSPRSESAGIWLLSLESFWEWRDSPTIEANCHVFCCYGIPGAGKSVFCSVVVDNLYPQAHDESIGIACLYADYQDQNNQSLVNILRSFLYQLLITTTEPIPDEVVKKLQGITSRRWRARREQLGTEDCLTLLKIRLLQLQHQHVFICIDAIDELDPMVRRELLNILKELCTRNIRLFLTGRGHIENEVQKCLQVTQKYTVVISANKQEIEAFVGQQIKYDPHPGAMDEVLEKDIMNVVIEKSQGMFILPTLHIKMILAMPTIFQRREVLESLPAGIYDWLQGIITRIKKSSTTGARLGMQVLMWLHFANRPLKIAELLHALSVEKSHKEFCQDITLSLTVLQDCCLGLVIVDEHSTVRFAHYTVEEYFRKYATLEFPNGYNSIAETCLTYLNFDGLRPCCRDNESLEEIKREYAFLDHAAIYWGTYVKQQHNNYLTNLARKLVEHETGHPPCAIQALNKHLFPLSPIAQSFSGIHTVAYFGLSANMAYLCNERRQIDLKDEFSQTPLYWAAKEGHGAVVQLLIGRDGVDINARSHDWNTPLSIAARNGHEAVVGLLIERDSINLNAKDSQGNTPLSLAARNGNEAVVRLLVERYGVDINAKDSDWNTPLSIAARNGHEAVVQLLIKRDDIDINAKDFQGNTPLSVAAEDGNEAIVRLLAEKDGVDIDSEGNGCKTALLVAAENGHDAVVRLLIKKGGVDINHKDIDGNTPLFVAAGKGHEAIVRLLIEMGGVEINSKNHLKQTPLHIATKNGHEAVVQLLVRRNNVDINVRDFKGDTPLALAANNGHETIVRLLREREKIDIANNNDNIELLLAAGNGHGDVVRQLVERDNVNINTRDSKGNTPLLVAVRNGHEAVVRLLLERGDIDVNAKDSLGVSPLLVAAQQGHEAFVRLLLERGDVNVNVMDNSGVSPLLVAAPQGHEAVVRLLLERGDVDVNAKGFEGNTPLLLAAGNGHEAVVRLLVERDNVNINTRDSEGNTPLLMAVRNGHEAVVRLLLKTRDVDVNAKGFEENTPLLLAAGNGHEAVVRLLVERDNVDINAKGFEGNTPLSMAAQNGHDAVVRLLIERGVIDIDTEDNMGKTPISMAAENGHEAVVRLLIESGHVDINARNNRENTPITYRGNTLFALAAKNGHEAVLRLLLERGDVDVNAKDNLGVSPLWVAALNGHEAIVRLLVEMDNVDINTKDFEGNTPLLMAAWSGYEAIVQLLVERDNVDIDTKNSKGNTPLWKAAACGYEAVVRLLVERDNVEINAKDFEGNTPLLMAAQNGHDAVVRLLLKRDDVDIYVKNRWGETPYSVAVANRHEGIELLLENHKH